MLSISRPALIRALPFAIYIGFLPLTQLLDGRLAGVDTRWLYAAQVGLVALSLLAFARQYGELRVPAALKGRDWLYALAAGVLVFVLWINLDHPWLTMGQGKGFDPRGADGAVDPCLAAVRLLGAAVVVPIMEELFWRSFLARWIDRPGFLEHPPQHLSSKALLLSSALFAIEHTEWFAGLLAGLIYGYLYKRCGNLWVPTIAHAVTNGLLGAWVLHSGAWQFW